MLKYGNKPRRPSRIAYVDALVRYYPDENKKYPVVTLCGSTRLKTVKGDFTTNIDKAGGEGLRHLQIKRFRLIAENRGSRRILMK